MTDFEKQMLAKLDAILVELRTIKEFLKRPALTVIHGGQPKHDERPAPRAQTMFGTRDDERKF